LPQFGLSNFPAKGIQEIHDYASSKGYVLPTVYEGNYSPITRHLETDILPLLRKLGISFYAYSPLAGGFLVKSAKTILEAKEARWNTDTRVGAMYQRMYNRPKLLAALSDWDSIAQEAGVSKAALAYKWVAYHSALSSKYEDAIIVGASRPAQLDDTLQILRSGPLAADIVTKIEKIWDSVKDQAPVDNYSEFV
jgi:aryl-alcohol dehydrogenase-like predicted oxidoreductase